MTPGQEAHLNELIGQFHTRASVKYHKGQAEHGGNLYDKPVAALIDDMVDEAIDQVIYALTLRGAYRREYVSKPEETCRVSVRVAASPSDWREAAEDISEKELSRMTMSEAAERFKGLIVKAAHNFVRR